MSPTKYRSIFIYVSSWYNSLEFQFMITRIMVKSHKVQFFNRDAIIPVYKLDNLFSFMPLTSGLAQHLFKLQGIYLNMNNIIKQFQCPNQDHLFVEFVKSYAFDNNKSYFSQFHHNIDVHHPMVIHTKIIYSKFHHHETAGSYENIIIDFSAFLCYQVI